MTPQSFHDRLDHLLAVAANVFADKGFHPTTMRDLARATGMSLAGIYHYVRSKDELLYHVQKRCFTRVLAGAETAIGEGDSAADRLERFIRHHVTFFADHMSEMKVLSHEANSLTGQHLTEINGLKRRYVELLRALIAEVDGVRRPSIDSQIAAYALFGMMNWIYNWYHPDGAVSPEVLADHFAQLFLNGLAASSSSSAPQGG